jgi:hypothetical protein
MYDSDGICWHQDFERCRLDHKGDGFFYYGRCRSGRRWFWEASNFRDRNEKAHGWENTEQEAVAAARAAVVCMAGGHKAFAKFRPGFASETLKQINKAKRAASPPSDSKDSKFVEYLYSYDRYEFEWTFYRFQIVKKTAKRIYYLSAVERAHRARRAFRLRPRRRYEP